MRTTGNLKPLTGIFVYVHAYPYLLFTESFIVGRLQGC